MTNIDFEQRPYYAQWAADKLKIDREYFGNCTTIAVLGEKRLEAVIVYSSYNGINCEVTVAAESKSWLKKHIIDLLMKYAFEQLGCLRITSLVREDNPFVINLTKKLGFQIEGCLRQFFPDRSNCLVLGLLKHERY